MTDESRSRRPSGSDKVTNHSRNRKPDRQPDVSEGVRAIDLNPTSPTRSERSSVHSASGKKRSKSRSRADISQQVASNVVVDESV